MEKFTLSPSPEQRISKKIWTTLSLSILLFLLVEIGLQFRAHVKYGNSLITTSKKQSMYYRDSRFGLKLLRPNFVTKGSQAAIESNSLGLRSPEISLTKPPGVLRVAIVGASTVMGAVTKSNGETISYQMERFLQPHFPNKQVQVINAGIPGHGLTDQRKMIEFVLKPLLPDYLVWYSGFNDISAYCRPTKDQKKSVQGIPKPELPKWLLSVELLTKNTVDLKTVAAKRTGLKDPSNIDTSKYQRNVEEVMQYVQSIGVPMLVLTNPRAYRREMPREEQQALSVTARYYNPCFDLDGLHDIFDVHNQLIVVAASKHGFPVLLLDRELAGGSRHFADSTHLTYAGTERAASIISEEIVDQLHGLAVTDLTKPAGVRP